jgi:hypothetical protein
MMRGSFVLAPFKSFIDCSAQSIWAIKEKEKMEKQRIFNFGLTEKLLALTVVTSVVMMLTACSKPTEAGTSIAIDSPLPAKIEKAYFYDGGRCEIDSTKPAASSNLISASRKSTLKVTGWVAEETILLKILPLAYVVLNGDHGTYYLEGKRLPRPDVAAALGDTMYENAGFETIENLSNIPIGKYKMSVASGDKSLVAICRTNFVVRIGK